jgi:hypothetical protein
MLGTIFLDRDGRAQDDGSHAAYHFLHELDHGLSPEDGQTLLDAIVMRLDPSTLVAARRCDDPSCRGLRKALQEADPPWPRRCSGVRVGSNA